MSAKIVLEPEGRQFSAQIGLNLLDIILGTGSTIEADCGGKGTCGKCRVIVKDQQNLSSVTSTERSHLSQEQLDNGYRLACQTVVLGDALIYLTQNKSGRRRIQETGIEYITSLEPAIRKFRVQLRPPHLGDTPSDTANLLQSLQSQHDIDVKCTRLGILRNLSETLRNSNWEVTAAVQDGKIISVNDKETQNSHYGLAVDIGTSKIVLQLIELESGDTISVASLENPQIIHGEDIYTRMAYSMEGRAQREELARLVAQGINTLILEFNQKTSIDPNDIFSVSMVGNTAMHHLLLGLPTKNLALSPFVPVISTGLDTSSRDLRLNLNPEGAVYLFPVVAGFVGGDAVADILATRIHEAEVMSLLIDIGTNTEICLGNRDGLICCSCASGPAFEGYHITHGVKAVTGAIEKIEIDSLTLEVHSETIGGTEPIGICGSGMVDALAEMLRTDIIKRDGRFNPNRREHIEDFQGRPALTVVSAEKSLTNEPIVITQHDIRELQLAKAAIYTGCLALFKEKTIEAKDIGVVYVAGAFGNYLKIKNTIAIGMLPLIPLNRFKMIGNAAVVGAKLGLLSKRERTTAEKIARETRYVELGAMPSFNQEFTAALNFPES